MLMWKNKPKAGFIKSKKMKIHGLSMGDDLPEIGPGARRELEAKTELKEFRGSKIRTGNI